MYALSGILHVHAMQNYHNELQAHLSTSILSITHVTEDSNTVPLQLP